MTAPDGPNTPPPLTPPTPPAGGTSGYPPISFPPSMYPPMHMPMPPAPRGGGFARAVFTSLAIMILTASITLNGYLIVITGIFSGSEATVTKQTLTEGDGVNTIAVLELEGMIDAQASDLFAEALKEVQGDSSVKAVVINMNTPGGTVTASAEIHDRVERFRKDYGLPVYVSMRDLGTSGGYFVACAADRVFAEETTWTGNIGVLIPRMSLAKLGEKYGVEDTTITSTGATYKHAGSLWKQDTPEQLAYWQGLADEASAVFKQVVMTGRKLDAATVDKIADGQVYTGPKALSLKLVDDLGNIDDAVAAAAKSVGVTKPHVVKFHVRPSLLDRIADKKSDNDDLLGMKSGSIDVSVSGELIRQMTASRPMYLWQGK